MSASLRTTKRTSELVEVEGGNKTRAVTFSANGEYLISGDETKVHVWRVEDGEQVATMTVGLANCLAVSKDGRWIAAGTFSGAMVVWDAQNGYKRVFAVEDHFVIGLDFSPDSTRLLTASFNRAAIVWDFVNKERTTFLPHDDELVAARYSPRGDRIAVATNKFIRVYDSTNSRLFVDIKAEVTPWYNTGLLWSNNQLFIISESKIKQIDVLTGSTVSEWPVPDSDASSCIALQQHREFVAYSSNRTVTIWDTSDKHAQLDLIQHTQIIRSISISPDNRFLAIAGERGKIVIRRLPRNITASDSVALSRLHPTFQEPDIQIQEAARESWKEGRLAEAEELLTAVVSTSLNSTHHVLASRALVRARLGKLEEAIADARESLRIQPSAIGYIARSLALVSNGERHKAYRACDIAFERFHSNHVSFILLVKAIVVFKAGEHLDAISRLDDLMATVRFNSICYIVQAKMYILLGDSLMEQHKYEDALQSFECARAKLRRHTSQPLLAISMISGWEFGGLDVAIRQRLCDALHAAGRTKDAKECFFQIINAIDEDVYAKESVSEWITDFTERCLSTSESDHETSSNEIRRSSAADSEPLLRAWTKSKLTRNSWRDSFIAADKFLVSRFTIHRAICERLEAGGQMVDAAECFHQMESEFSVELDIDDEERKWAVEFRLRCGQKLEVLGDVATNSHEYDDAISLYSAALSLDPVVAQDLFIKRSEAYTCKGLWENALDDANTVIGLDPSSPWGYERKHAALHKAGYFDDAIGSFGTMRSIMLRSPDPEIRERYKQYIDPEKTKAVIQKAVKNVLSGSPRVLINTNTGGLVDKSKRESSFESQLVFKELISAMTTRIDRNRIEQEVTKYYRYATFSHTWEDSEPSFEDVIQIVVYNLRESATHNKLQMFCKIAKSAGFHWAWSDTCCINKGDHVVHQEALVSMFKWYEGSALTIVFLRGVRSPSRRGDLMRSVWNTRAWTFQEYHASKVVRFYNEDWTPYLGLRIHNHKESPEIVAEMEEATGVSAEVLKTIRPGLTDIREKLCLAARRETTFVEDAAYSLLGIFSSALPVVYGEGDQALGRLLRHLLACSGDTSILAWTGKSGSFNSSLPTNITVFEQFPPPHIPRAIEGAEMEIIVAKIRCSSIKETLITRLYEQLDKLSVPSFSENRMKLPCLAFQLGPLSAAWSSSGRVYRAKAGALGIIEIKTPEDLTQLSSLTLVHPWIDFLLDRLRIESITETVPTRRSYHRSSSMSYSTASSGGSTFSTTILQRRKTLLGFRIWPPSRNRDDPSLPFPATTSSTDKRTSAFQLLARLRQPFGALLLTPTRQNFAEYRRVASETMIQVQVQEDAPLEMLIESVQTLDLL